MTTLSSLGWDDSFTNAFQPHAALDLTPARVVRVHKHAYDLLGANGALSAVCTGHLLHVSVTSAALPAVGDWVAMRPRNTEAASEALVDIHAVLPRRTCLSRASAGAPGQEQVLAANVDTVFLVMGLDANFNLRRIERGVSVVRASGAQPVVVLTKADLHPCPEEALSAVRRVVRTIPVIALSAVGSARDAVAAVNPWLTPGTTIVLLGSSGVGKSTLINRLLGTDVLATAPVSTAVNKGRHTTARRELVALASGALVIDTPGIRELQLWQVGESALADAFDDIARLTAQCRFADCTHGGEPGCAVSAALEDGTLDPGRWESFQKLSREQAYAARRADPELARVHRERWKKIHVNHRQRLRIESREDNET